jgi:hypothetical protein
MKNIRANSKQIIPWRCHVCGREFDTMSGGLCSKCGKVTCNICFGIGTLKRLGQMKVPNEAVCRNCATAKEEKDNAK